MLYILRKTPCFERKTMFSNELFSINITNLCGEFCRSRIIFLPTSCFAISRFPKPIAVEMYSGWKPLISLGFVLGFTKCTQLPQLVPSARSIPTRAKLTNMLTRMLSCNSDRKKNRVSIFHVIIDST